MVNVLCEEINLTVVIVLWNKHRQMEEMGKTIILSVFSKQQSKFIREIKLKKKTLKVTLPGLCWRVVNSLEKAMGKNFQVIYKVNKLRLEINWRVSTYLNWIKLAWTSLFWVKKVPAYSFSLRDEAVGFGMSAPHFLYCYISGSQQTCHITTVQQMVG